MAVNYRELAFSFPCAGEDLLGIIAAPERSGQIGVLVVVGGPQYRVGSHRQFLLLSRALATAGYPAMRFDFRGMGDSSGDLRDFTAVNADIAAAIDVFLERCPELVGVVLLGLCDGASASLLYLDARGDARVQGVVLLNPWVRSAATLARTRVKHYYGQRLLEGEFWRKLLSGNLGVGRALGGFARSILILRQNDLLQEGSDALPFQKKMLRGLATHRGAVLLLLSEDDYTAREFVECVSKDEEWESVLGNSRLTSIDVKNADHTFSSSARCAEVEDAVINWLGDALGSLEARAKPIAAARGSRR
jgi:exosortase A-associated hydrolase 1